MGLSFSGRILRLHRGDPGPTPGGSIGLLALNNYIHLQLRRMKKHDKLLKKSTMNRIQPCWFGEFENSTATVHHIR